MLFYRIDERKCKIDNFHRFTSFHKEAHCNTELLNYISVVQWAFLLSKTQTPQGEARY